MKKANFLFGYAMKGGQIIVNEDEKIVVEKIYSDYLENFSAEHIAESLNAIGVAYKNKRGWNKNIVYRILDDNRYLGVDGYPMIICREKWENVEKRRKANTTKYMDAGFQELRRKMVCARCGGALIRNKQKREAAWWQCKMCGAKTPTIDDMEITRLVFTKISGLEKHPEIINAGADTASINIEAVRRQRDFERLLVDPGVSTVELDELAKQITQLKYNDIDPGNREYAAKQILEALQAPLTGRDKENYLFRQTVFKILLGEKATVQLKLKNGQII